MLCHGARLTTGALAAYMASKRCKFTEVRLRRAVLFGCAALGALISDSLQRAHGIEAMLQIERLAICAGGVTMMAGMLTFDWGWQFCLAEL